MVLQNKHTAKTLNTRTVCINSANAWSRDTISPPCPGKRKLLPTISLHKKSPYTLQLYIQTSATSANILDTPLCYQLVQVGKWYTCRLWFWVNYPFKTQQYDTYFYIIVLLHWPLVDPEGKYQELDLFNLLMLILI